jgi:hypothetical protein
MVETKSEEQLGRRIVIKDSLGDAKLIGLMNRLPRWPDLNFWGGLADQFNTRNLTYESDAVDALIGATDALTRTYRPGFFYGIPEFFFDIGLLWEPNRSVQRRMAIDNNGQNSLPSWSWIGWKG